MKLSEYLEKYELDPYDQERFDLENSIFVREVFSREHECHIALFQSSDTLEKSFLVSTNTESTLYTRDDFYEMFLPNVDEFFALMSGWYMGGKSRTTENAERICALYDTIEREHEDELDVEEKLSAIGLPRGEDSETLDYLTKEGADAFFEAALETLVNFWRGKILDEFKEQGINQKEIDANGEGLEQSILPDVLSGTPVSEAVQDWLEWKKQDLEEREEEDA